MIDIGCSSVYFVIPVDKVQQSGYIVTGVTESRSVIQGQLQLERCPA